MIEIRHLYKAFDNHMVLRNLNMKINDGAVYGFVGPNGAGKTTTMRIIAGLLKADSGQILIDGEDIGVRHKELIDIAVKGSKQKCRQANGQIHIAILTHPHKDQTAVNKFLTYRNDHADANNLYHKRT